MLEKVKERLEALGYELKDGDEALIAFAVGKVQNTVKNDCNVPEVPDGLEHIAIDMAVGEFLTAKKTFAPSDLAGFDLDAAVKQIQVGDTNTTFAVDQSMNDEQRLDALITHFLTYGRDQFSCFRRVRW